jgi:hypothetical protein
MRFAETVKAMLERDEGLREQGALERSANETLERPAHDANCALLRALADASAVFPARNRLFGIARRAAVHGRVDGLRVRSSA